MRRKAGSAAAGERGQALSVFVMVTVLALLLVAGLVVDGGRKGSADRRAELTAAAAARAAVDATAADRQTGRRPNPALAVQAARDVLSAAGIDGEVSLAGDGSVQVTVSTTVPTVLLSLIGVNALEARGSATAQLFD